MFPFSHSCCYPLPDLKGRAFLHLLLVPARILTCAVCSLLLIKSSLGIKQTNTKDCSVGRREEGRWSYRGHWSHLMLEMPRSAPPMERSGSGVRLPIVHRALAAFPAPHPQEEAGLPPSWERVGCFVCRTFSIFSMLVKALWPCSCSTIKSHLQPNHYEGKVFLQILVLCLSWGICFFVLFFCLVFFCCCYFRGWGGWFCFYPFILEFFCCYLFLRKSLFL